MSNDIAWTISPKEGLLPVRFGDAPEQVATSAALGPVPRSLPGLPGEATEFRGLEEPTISYRENKVFYIAVGYQTRRVQFGDVRAFTDAPRTVLQAFERVNRQAGFVQLGSVVFEGLNLSVEGYYMLPEDAYFDPDGQDQDDRVIVLHAPGTVEVFDNMPKTLVTFL